MEAPRRGEKIMVNEKEQSVIIYMYGDVMMEV